MISTTAIRRVLGENSLGRLNRNAKDGTATQKSLGEVAWLRVFLARFNEAHQRLGPFLTGERDHRDDEDFHPAFARALYRVIQIPLPFGEHPSDTELSAAGYGGAMGDLLPDWLKSVHRALSALAEGKPAGFDTRARTILLPDSSGRVDVVEASFFGALTGRLIEVFRKVGVERLGVCTICSSFFFAPRRRSMRCSAHCDNRHRQRVFYQREKNRVELAADLLSAGRPVNEITKLLRVSPKRARSYVMRARRRKNGVSQRSG
jgi:hypothetical protein